MEEFTSPRRYSDSQASDSSQQRRLRFLSFNSSNDDGRRSWTGDLLSLVLAGNRVSSESRLSSYDSYDPGGLPTRDELQVGDLYTLEEASERSSADRNEGDFVADSADIADDLTDQHDSLCHEAEAIQKKNASYNKACLAAFVLLSCGVQAFLMVARVSECEKDDLKSFHRFSSCIEKMSACQAILFYFNTLVAYIVNCLSSWYFFKIPTVITIAIISKQLPPEKKSFSHVLTALVLSVLSLSCFPAYDYLLTKDDELGFNEIKTLVALFCANNRTMISLYGFFLTLPPRRGFEIIQTITSARAVLTSTHFTHDSHRLVGEVLGFGLSIFTLFALININETPLKPWGLFPFYLFAVLLISVQAAGDVISNIRAIGENIVLQWNKGKLSSSLFILSVALLCTWGAYVLADDLFNIIQINDDFHDFYQLPSLVLQRLMHASTTLITFSGATNSLAWFFDARTGRIPPLRQDASRQVPSQLTESNLLRINLLAESGQVPRYDKESKGFLSECYSKLFNSVRGQSPHNIVPRA